MNESDVRLQREYYRKTAASYQQRHVGAQDEHALALDVLIAFARHLQVNGSFLDVGAGTGRAMHALATAFPGARIQGIEPVAELREQARLLHGFTFPQLEQGDALHLPFPDNSFDWVVETGVLHHIFEWRRATAEMIRVARHGVLISDSNNIGQVQPGFRQLKKIINQAGFWNLFVWLQTKGKMRKYSEGDGVYYSFCAFDVLPLLRSKFPQIHAMNTQGSVSADLLTSVSHLALIAHNTRFK